MTSERTQARRRETKARLEAALLDLLGTHTFQQLRIEDIAETAGLSRSGFYFYFRDKQSLLMDATTELADQLFEEADLWWHGEGEPRELVGIAIRGVTAGWIANENMFRTAFEVSTYDEQMREFWRGTVNRFIEATAEHILREKERGRVAESLDARGTAELLIWGLERTLYVYATAGDDTERMVETTIATWLRAIYGIGPED